MNEYKIDYCHHDSVTAESSQEYIKREDAIKLKDICTDTYADKKYFIEKLKAIPPADVVEAVRCKSCKYRIDGNCYVSNFIAGLPCMIRYVGEDDYCSYGKPKE